MPGRRHISLQQLFCRFYLPPCHVCMPATISCFHVMFACLPPGFINSCIQHCMSATMSCLHVMFACLPPCHVCMSCLHVSHHVCMSSTMSCLHVCHHVMLACHVCMSATRFHQLLHTTLHVCHHVMFACHVCMSAAMSCLHVMFACQPPCLRVCRHVMFACLPPSMLQHCISDCACASPSDCTKEFHSSSGNAFAQTDAEKGIACHDCEA